MPKRASDSQLERAVAAPPRPTYDAVYADNLMLWYKDVSRWAATWDGPAPPLNSVGNSVEWTDWWRKTKRAHDSLLARAAKRSAAAGAAEVRPLQSVTTKWVASHFPAISRLDVVSAERTPSGRHDARQLRALVRSPRGEHDATFEDRVISSRTPESGEEAKSMRLLRLARRRSREVGALQRLTRRFDWGVAQLASAARSALTAMVDAVSGGADAAGLDVGDDGIEDEFYIRDGNVDGEAPPSDSLVEGAFDERLFDVPCILTMLGKCERPEDYEGLLPPLGKPRMDFIHALQQPACAALLEATGCEVGLSLLEIWRALSLARNRILNELLGLPSTCDQVPAAAAKPRRRTLESAPTRQSSRLAQAASQSQEPPPLELEVLDVADSGRTYTQHPRRCVCSRGAHGD